MMPSTRFSRQFGLTLPVLLAPMAIAGGGALAAACASAGILGLVGGGYGDPDWVLAQYQIAEDQCADDAARARLGCGFITWCLDKDSRALDALLDQHAPATVFLSFGDARHHARKVKARGWRLVLQLQEMADLTMAVEAEPDIIVMQGGEAGGHGRNVSRARGTMALVPEAADWLAQRSPDTLLLAAGGIADGRGIAAAIALGADGALMGSRFWASAESLAAGAAKQIAAESDGDSTARNAVFDILRRKSWPEVFDFRALRNSLSRQWEDDIAGLTSDPAPAIADYEAGVAAQDFARAHITVGEAVGLIRDLLPASDIVARLQVEFAASASRLVAT